MKNVVLKHYLTLRFSTHNSQVFPGKIFSHGKKRKKEIQWGISNCFTNLMAPVAVMIANTWSW